MCNQVLYISFMQDGMNALHLAAMGGHVKTLQYLAPKMASLLHSTDHQGFTMLHWAAERGQAEVARVLLEEYKLDPTTHDKVIFTPLSHAQLTPVSRTSFDPVLT